MRSKLSCFITRALTVGSPFLPPKGGKMRTNKACIVGRFKKRGAIELLEYMVKEGGVE